VTTHARSRFLELGALASLANLRYTVRRRIDGARSGRHASRQQGGAGEFVDFRQYAPGEDLRRLDWKVLARTGRSFVRLHQDETTLSTLLVIDASKSMTFAGVQHGGGRLSKLEYAQYLTTALSHIIALGQDQVGLAVIANGLQAFLPPGGTPTHLALLHEEIERVKSNRSVHFASGLGALFRRVQRRGAVLVLSDFLQDDLEETFAALRLFQHYRCELVVLHLVDPDEERLPDGRAFRFESMETTGRADCSPQHVAEQYRRRFENHCAMVRSMALAIGCDYRRVSTGIPYLQTLGGFLIERAG